jgi:hypothetical protein
MSHASIFMEKSVVPTLSDAAKVLAFNVFS